MVIMVAGFVFAKWQGERALFLQKLKQKANSFILCSAVRNGRTASTRINVPDRTIGFGHFSVIGHAPGYGN